MLFDEQGDIFESLAKEFFSLPSAAVVGYNYLVLPGSVGRF
jgi:hypothetical protein